MKKSRSKAAFTLIEIVLVVAIMAMLLTAGFPMFGYFREKAGYAGCVSNLRIIHVGLNTYMIDHDMVWPQVPDIDVDNEQAEFKWWAEKLKDEDVAARHWVCPSDNSVSPEEKKNLGKGEFFGSYLPTMFDDMPNTAFKWKQPWVIERGSYHGEKKGPNMLMPDGTVMEGPVLMGGQ